MLSYSIFEEQFTSLVGSYMRTTLYQSPGNHVCSVCCGLKQEDDVLCYQCGKTKRDAERAHAPLADIVRIGYYAVQDKPSYEQFCSTMYRYKDKQYQEDMNVIRYILTDAFIIHWESLIRLSSGVTPTAWAIVPSSKRSIRYGQAHPLHAVLRTLFDACNLPEVRLKSLSVKKREFNPHAFAIDTCNHVNLSHVILVDDSWASGNSVQSAASILKQTGASLVTIYCISRIIDLGYWKEKLPPSVITGFLKRDFNNDHDPWRELY